MVRCGVAVLPAWCTLSVRLTCTFCAGTSVPAPACLHEWSFLDFGACPSTLLTPLSISGLLITLLYCVASHDAREGAFVLPVRPFSGMSTFKYHHAYLLHVEHPGASYESGVGAACCR